MSTADLGSREDMVVGERLIDSKDFTFKATRWKGPVQCLVIMDIGLVKGTIARPDTQPVLRDLFRVKRATF